MTQPCPDTPLNSLGEIETPDQLVPTPNVGGELPDPPQTPVVDAEDGAA